jgi:hypothetical protein
MFSAHFSFGSVASLSLLLVACGGDGKSPNLPLVIALSRPDRLSAELVPNTVEEAIDALGRGLSGTDFRSMQVLSEEDAVASAYGVAQWVRHWGLSAGGGLRHELASAGFEDLDDMSDAVLTCFWRRLHGRPLDLNGQLRRARALRDGTQIAAHVVVFSAQSAHTLVHQCSRRVPTSFTGAWSPDASTLRHLEGVWLAVLQEAIDRTTPPGSQSLRAAEYYRQYGGLIIGGRRIVYINGFHRAHLRMISVNPEGATDWRTRAVNVCDGGRAYFGAEYDPTTGRVESIEFNASG